jgi:hypothetical protein
MNKIAQYIEHFKGLGAQDALQQIETEQTKQAGILPTSRMGRLGVGALGALGLGAGYKALQPEDPGMLDAALSGGKDMLSNLSPEDLAMYGNLLGNLGQGGGGAMGYDSYQPSPADYALQDIEQDPYASMGYETQMSPEEAAQYYAYYNS